jgi:hypothetical protein
MRPLLRIVSIASLVVLLALAATVLAQSGGTSSSSPADTTARIVTAAQAVLTALDEAGRTKVQFPFDSPQKSRWSNLPSPMFQRTGVRLADLTAPQRAAVMNLLSVALSPDGYRKVVDIMRGDEVLRTTQTGGGRGRGAGGPAFGENEYYLAFVGTPSATAPWMLQFGGHHLAVNLTMAGSQATMAPSLPATQPAAYSFEGQTVRPLGDEHDKAFALVNALDEKQRSQAVLTNRVADLVLGAGQDGKTIQPQGVRVSALSAAQQTMLWDLVREWAGIMNDAFAEPRMKELRSNARETFFAWSGPTTNGSAAYFRVQGPTLVVEYAPQNSTDHIHTIYRDPTNDYGAGMVRSKAAAATEPWPLVIVAGTALITWFRRRAAKVAWRPSLMTRLRNGGRLPALIHVIPDRPRLPFVARVARRLIHGTAGGV